MSDRDYRETIEAMAEENRKQAEQIAVHANFEKFRQSKIHKLEIANKDLRYDNKRLKEKNAICQTIIKENALMYEKYQALKAANPQKGE